MKKNLSISISQLLKGFFVLIMAVFVHGNLFAQSFDFNINQLDYKKIPDARVVYINNNTPAVVNMDMSFLFDNNQFDYVYISDQGWISFDNNTTLKSLVLESNAQTFISPLAFFDKNGDALKNFDVSYKKILFYKDACFVVQWENDEIAFQAFLYEQGSIEFTYHLKSMQETDLLAQSSNILFGVVNSETYIGYFPFDFLNKKGKDLPLDEIVNLNTNNNTPIIKNRVGFNNLNGPTPKTITTFTSSGTWTCPAGVTEVTVHCIGGGGGGGGTKANNAYGGGGGAGGSYARKIVTVVPGTDYTITVGVGGVAGNNGGGGIGGASWFNTTGTVYAVGGAGGSEPNGGIAVGGNGTTTGCIGTTVYAGGDAGNGTGSGGISGGGGGGAGSNGAGGNASNRLGGIGTTDNGGTGGNGRSDLEGDGRIGLDYGGGGSGAFVKDNTDHLGGAGADGVVWLEYTSTLSGTEIACFDFDSGTDGWTEDNGTDWALVTPTGGDHTGGGDAWITGGNGNYALSTDSWLISPVIDLSTGTNAYMTFYMWLNSESGYDGGNLVGYDGTGWYEIPAADVSPTYNSVAGGWDAWGGTYAAWTAVTVDLSAYTNSDFQVAFDFYSDVSNSDGGWAIDDVCFYNTPYAACSGTPTAGTITSDIADFCGTGTPTLTAAGYESGVTGITFQWQSSPDNSVWTDIIGANSTTYTSPEISQTMYYRLNVTCTNSSTTSTTNVVTVTNISQSITGTNSPVNIACSNTANLTATATGGTIYWYDVATGGAALGTGGSFTTPVLTGNTTFYVSAGTVGCESSRTPVNVVITSGVTAPDCANLTSPTNGATGVGTVILNWDASNTDCQQATSYLLYFGTDNPPTNIVNGADIGNVTSYTPVGLVPPETYYWKIVPTNSVGDASGCEIYSFTTTDITYCDPSNGVPSSTYFIDDFSTTGGSTNITNNSSGYSTNGYGDFTAMTVTALPSGTVNFSISGGGSSLTYGFGIWVDWNQDGDFADTDEEVYMSSAYASSVSGSFTLPAGAVVGSTRMRVISDYLDSTPEDPCWGDSNTEAEDYTFTVGALADCSGTPTAGTISSDIADFCGFGEPTLTAAGYESGVSGISFQWQSSPDGTNWTDIAGATSTSLTDNITTTTYYQLIVTCDNSGISSTTNSVMVENTSDLITGTNVSYSGVCNTTATLTATSDGGTIYWYDQASGGTVLASGSPYSPTITGSTTFYVAAGDGGTTGNVGKVTSDLSDGYYGSIGTGLVFDALTDMTIVSVDVYVQTAGSDVSVKLLNSAGTEITSTTISSCPAGLQTLTLNFNVTTGTDYRLVSNNTTNLARDFSSDLGVTFPYTLSGVCSITGGWLSSAAATYYFFYNWVVSSGCESARTPVDVTVTSGLSVPSCSANPYPLDAAVNIDPDDDLSWDASVDPCQQATSYILYFGTDNPPTNIVNGVDIGDVLSYDPGLLNVPETYYWKIVPVNSAGTATGCDVWSFTTDYTYCESSANYTSYMDITNVTFETINNSSSYNSLTGSQGTASGTEGMYSDWRSSAVPVPIVSQGQTYPFSVTIDDAGTSYSHRVDVYIDFNHDGDLVDAGEAISIFPYANPSTPNTTNVNITIPIDAITGNTLMRVIVVGSTSSSACGTYTYGETEDYLLQVGIPGTNTITAGAGAEPALFATSIDTQAGSVLNFDFTVNDDGDTPATDNLPTLISQITIIQGAGNTITDWSSVIGGAVLEASDGTTQTANVTINPTSIVFSNVDNSGGEANLGEIDDNDSKTYTLKVWLNCPLTDLTEGDNFVFKVNYATILVEGSVSSGFAIGETENSGAANNAIQTDATHIEIIEQPTNVEVGMVMFPHFKVAAVDDCGVIDLDYAGSVSLSSTGAMTGDPITVNFVDGIAVFELIHTVAGSGYTLTATSGAMNVISDPFNVVIKDCQIVTTPASTAGELFLCQGAVVDFDGVYSGVGTPTSWTWRMGDGHEVSTEDVSDYLFDAASGYYVELTVHYEGLAEGTCATAVHIMVSPGPTINNVSSDIESCDGFTYDLTASGAPGSAIEVVGYSGTGAVALSLADETYLPDIENDAEIYESSLEYTQFDPTSTLTNGNFVTVYANLEHSFWGDLEIWLECPNGQTAHLTDGQTNGWNGSGASGTFLGEPVDEDVIGTPGNGMEYRWTMVAPTFGASMDDISFISPFPYEESYTDNAGTDVNNHDYYPEGSYYPLDDFSNLIGCPLNGVWTIYVKDFLGVDDGYIFEWGLELDESLMPGQWDYTAEIVDYDWTGAGVVEAHPTGAETSVTPPSYGNNIYTLTVTDEYGCSTDQDVTVTLLQCDGVWTGDVSTDWFTDANWGRGFVPDGSCEGGFGRNVTIPDVSSTSGNFPVIAGVANCDDFTVDAGANVKIAPGGALTVCGTMTNNGGNAGVVLLSDATGDGSLIHSNTGVVGTVQKYIPGTRYHYIGSPVIAATTTGIGVNTTQFYKWDATMHWNGMGGDPYGTPSTIDYAPWGTTYSGNLDNGTGYAYYHETQTLQFVGEINVGDYNLTLFDESGNTVDPNQGWNLISNPYASAIDWDLVVSAGWDNDVEGAIYMFDDDGSGYQTNYRYYIPGAVGSINYGIGTQDATQSIPVGQGFFVKAAKDNKPLALKAADRAHASQAFYKNNRSYNNLMRLNVSTQNYSDELVVRLLEDATFEYDGLLDARKLIPTNPLIPQIFAISDQGNNMAITSLPMYTDTSNVMLCVVAMPGNLTISASEFTFEPDRKVFLHDKQEEVFVSLMEDEQYNFFFEGGLNSTRFELLFTANQAPYINIQVDNISTLEDYSFDYTLNQSTFIDPDGDFELSASLMGGLELPQWLNFDPINNVFWGQPDNSDVGVYYVQVTATDEFGASVSETFSIEVINTNDEPFLNIPIPDFDVYMNEPIVIKLPANTFIDVDVNDRFAYSATFNNDMLPTWLHFDENNLLFSGIPINISPEDYEIQLTATDVAGAKAHDVFLISVKGVTGLNDFGNVLSVHPNPSIGLFTMSVSDISYVDYDVYIFDATGKLIYSAQANSDNYEIDLTGVASGVYSIRVVFDNQTFNKKLIIK